MSYAKQKKTKNKARERVNSETSTEKVMKKKKKKFTVPLLNSKKKCIKWNKGWNGDKLFNLLLLQYGKFNIFVAAQNQVLEKLVKLEIIFGVLFLPKF